MKKKIISIIGIAVFAVAVALNISVAFNKDTEMDLYLANTEALAMKEDVITCTKSNCCGGLCHEFSYILSCPCKANGDPTIGSYCCK